MKSKKWLEIFMVIALLFSLVACSTTNNSSNKESTPAKENGTQDNETNKGKFVTVYMLESNGQFTYQYDSCGNMIQKEYNNFRYEFEYDKENKLLKQTEYFKNGNPAYTEYLYNNDGALIGETLYYQNEKQSWIEYEYGSDGKVIKSIEHNISADDGSQWQIEYQHIYDTAGNLIQKTFDSSGSCFAYEYDDRGNRIKYSLIMQGKSPEFTFTFEYNSMGNVTKKISQSNGSGNLNNTAQYEYNSEGYPFQAIVSHDDNTTTTTPLQYRKFTMDEARARELQKRYNETDNLNESPVVVIIVE